MSTLTDMLFGQETKKATEVVLPLDPERAKPIVEGLDGTADRVLMQISTGKYEVWQKMAKQRSLIINDEPTTRIGEYDVPGRYKFVNYTSRD